MSFNFAAQLDSDEETAPPLDLSEWTSTVDKKRKRPSPNPDPPVPRQQSSGFQAVNAPALGLLPPAPMAPIDLEEDFVIQDDQHQGESAPTRGVFALSDDEGQSAGQAEESDDLIELPDAPAPAEGLPAAETSDTIAVTGPKVVIVIPQQKRSRSSSVVDFTQGGDIVRRVLGELEELDANGRSIYQVEFEDRHTEEQPYDTVIRYHNGKQAYQTFVNTPAPEPSLEPAAKRTSTEATKMSSSRPGRRTTQRTGMVSTIDNVSDEGNAGNSSDEEIELEPRPFGRRKKKQYHAQYVDEGADEEDEEVDAKNSEEDTGRRPGLRRGLRKPKPQPVGVSLRSADVDDGSDSEGAIPFLQSDLPGTRRTRKMRSQGPAADFVEDEGDDIGYNNAKKKAIHAGERQSTRAGRHTRGMEEVGEDNIFRSDSDDAARPPPKPKATGAREAFKQLPRNDEFRMRHNQQCETCGNGNNFAPIIYCQGCTLAYHKGCLGHRTTREHLVTKIGDGNFVLQCRRCIAFPKSKDPTAPDQGKCQDCHNHGPSNKPFRPRKTPAQEQRDRDENDGEDPIYNIHEDRINKADNVMFRCLQCFRGFHFEHLPSRSDMMDIDMEVDPEQRFREYSRDWKCKDCATMPAKVSGIIAWKPIDEDIYDPAVPYDKVSEDDKAYLLKWEGMSYFQAMWMPGPWVWGVTASSMRKAFGKREDAQNPKMRTEAAIPEDFLRADIVLDIKYTSFVDIRGEEIDKARIREIDKALVKYKGLGYEDAVWEAPPSPDDGDRWTDFVTAYNDWVLGRYVKQPGAKSLKNKIEKARNQDFSKLEKDSQPENMKGGELMKYQIDGLNWLYYKWYTQKNAILADEMGLGKTIQIIAFLATLVQDWSCFPFLIVVPNSTCPNWRREIKRWAPSLRVVAFFGSKESRDLAYKYEMFPENSKDLKCHVVVTSYDAAADDSCRKFFRSVPWQGLIVDEGQRLKNDKNQLYSALNALKFPFKVLLTGTPLQNNQRELFNLLHFLDESYNAEQLDQEYSELNKDSIHQLHDLIRPFFLRRTKAQVLTFLPPMAQIILPVSMSLVQKKLYRNILAKNPDLIRAIFASDSNATLGKGERGSLSNILMQLRKCLCHPFAYNRSIEERNVDHAISHRNLVDASSKLKLLEVLLPKLRERGHRVLIFSQFLDMLDMTEDFLDGMEMPYQRLDGSIGSLQKQKRIDEFNEPGSPLFAFLLSTRAGGVGINLATADTVIILDPDFNPHQDIQALSRAHRIGQHKKVLCFQLVTRASAEERIMQIGRKKLALDHVLIESMDADDASNNDLVSVLRHGASELFSDDGDQDIVYDSNSVEHLLDRSHMEDTQTGADKSAETQFSFARVWANDSGALEESTAVEDAEQLPPPDPGVWDAILKERERAAAEEAAAKVEAFGRGRRNRHAIDYGTDRAPDDAMDLDPLPGKRSGKKVKDDDASDTDFQAEESEPESGAEEGEQQLDADDIDAVRGGEEDGTNRTTGKKKGKKAPSSTTTSTPQSTPAKPKANAKLQTSASNVKKPGAVGATLGKSKAKATYSASDMKKTLAAAAEAKRATKPAIASPKRKAAATSKAAPAAKKGKVSQVKGIGNDRFVGLAVMPRSDEVYTVVDLVSESEEEESPKATAAMDETSDGPVKKSLPEGATKDGVVMTDATKALGGDTGTTEGERDEPTAVEPSVSDKGGKVDDKVGVVSAPSASLQPLELASPMLDFTTTPSTLKPAAQSSTDAAAAPTS
ncbi:hypothetical protein MBLNU230_g3902t1 [Neophaeotheca triangularis]